MWGDEFIGSYLSLGNNRSIMNEELHLMSMLSLVGKCLKGTEINIRGTKVDLRLHPLMVQRSGSGKDPVFNLAREIATNAGINFVTQSSLTSAAFIGSSGKNREPIPGVASQCDILAFKEISSLFSASGQDHSSDLINMINQALDYGGWIKKDLGGMSGSISYKTDVALLGTTYPPKSKVSYIETGLLPRTLFGYKEVGSKFYFDVAKWLFDNVGEPEEEKVTTKIDELSKTLREIKTKAYETKFTFPDRKTFHSIKDVFEDSLSKYPLRVQKTVEPYITRTSINTIKVATCFAALDNMSSRVRTEHINRACNVMKYSINGFLAFHARYDTLVSSNTMLVKDLLYKIKENTKVTDLQTILKMSGGLSLRDVNSALDTLKSTGEIIVEMVLDSGRPEKKITILLD